MSEPTLRPAGGDDTAALGRISRAVGQPATDSGADPAYVAHVLATGRALVAERAGRVVGWGAARDGAFGSMLTDLFVAPDEQGRGVGRRLLAELWPPCAAGRAPRWTFSSQHPHALPVYLRAGLRPAWLLLYLRGPRPDAAVVGDLPRVGTADPDAATAAEATIAGVARVADHRYWAAMPGGAGVVVGDPDAPLAVGAVAEGVLLHLAVAPDAGDAAARAALLAALTAVPCAATGTATGTATGGATGGAPDHGPDGGVTVRVAAGHPAVGDLLDRGWRIDEVDVALTSPGVALPQTWAWSPAFG